MVKGREEERNVILLWILLSILYAVYEDLICVLWITFEIAEIPQT